MGNPAPQRSVMHVNVRPASHAEEMYLPNVAARRPAMVTAEGRVTQIPAHPSYNLVYQGGKTIPHLTFTFTLLYVGGAGAWSGSDRANIDQAISGAMADRDLNNVVQQYFSGTIITSAFHPSRVLSGSPPATVSQSNAEQIMSNLYQQGQLSGFDYSQTVFGLVLPSGTVLNDNSSSSGLSVRALSAAGAASTTSVSSLEGLGGYHDAVQVGNTTLYYAIVVYAEHLSSGQDNGIVAFDQPWKNVVAALYHELNEARTDPDVNGTPGWISNPISDFGGQSVEVGDAPVFEAGNNLSLVFREVPLVNGGTAPVQFLWSDDVSGPEGPRTTPDPPAATSGAGAGGGPSPIVGIILAIVVILAIIAGFFILHH
jgi:hypothetical protein